MTYEDDAADLRGAHVPTGPAPVYRDDRTGLTYDPTPPEARPVRTVPVDVPPRTAAAIAANVRRRLDRNADELRAAGWFVLSPESIATAEDEAVRAFIAAGQR